MSTQVWSWCGMWLMYAWITKVIRKTCHTNLPENHKRVPKSQGTNKLQVGYLGERKVQQHNSSVQRQKHYQWASACYSLRNNAKRKSRYKWSGHPILDGVQLKVNDGWPRGFGNIFEPGDDHAFELHPASSEAPPFVHPAIEREPLPRINNTSI